MRKNSTSFVILLLLAVTVSSFLMGDLTPPSDAQKSAHHSINSDFLTAEEQAWIADNPVVRIAYDGSFPPFSYFDEKNQLVGYAVDTLDAIGNKVGIHWQIDHRNVWKDLYQAAITKQVDVVATMVDRPDRKDHFLFTDAFIQKSLVIITHTDSSRIKTREELNGKTVAMVSDYQYSRRVLEEFPDAVPYFVNDIRSALFAVESKTADATIMSLAAAVYWQKKYRFSQLKFAAHYDQSTANESIAIRNDKPLLASILQKGLKALTEQEKRAIDSRWQTRLKVPVDYKAVITTILVSVIFVSILLIWLFMTKRQNNHIKVARSEMAFANNQLNALKEDLEQQVLQRTEQLQNSEKKYRSLVESLNEEYFFYQRNPQGMYLYASPSLHTILGYSTEDFIGQSVQIYTEHPDNEVARTYMRRILRGEKMPSYEVEVYDSNQNKRRLKVLENPLFNNQGQIIGVEGIAQDITLLAQTQEQLNWFSFYDDLTGLANRRLFLIQFEHIIDQARRNNESIALLFLDVDRFKFVNDNLGHLMGDEVLRETSARLTLALRESDIAARIGGDEFTLILPKTDAIGAEIIARQILQQQTQPYRLDDQDFVLSTSIGVAIFPQDGDDAITLIKQADTAMYAAKRLKKGMAFCAPDQLAVNSRNLILEQGLRQALATNRFDSEFELQMYYQAKHCLKTRMIVGYEALIRWFHPQLGTIMPLEFILIAEETGIIESLSRWVVGNVCRQMVTWDKNGIEFGKVAVNISGVDLGNQDLAELILDQINQTRAKSHWIEVEVTESALMRSPEISIAVLQKLVDFGIDISIDDFGTGYSSLAYLKNLPAAYLKIDRSFIQNVLTCKDDQTVVQAVIALAHTMGKKVVAEGVETEEQWAYLREVGCDQAQGYWFSKPMPSHEVFNYSVRAQTIYSHKN